MMARRTGPLLGVALTLGLAAGCDDEQPDPTGDLERPSALVVIDRPGQLGEIKRSRADLLIVDSEAQGVRVQQYLQTQELQTQILNGEAVTSTITLRQAEFVLGPAVHFPLVIPAEGFPTEIAAVEGRDRAYTIAASAPRRVPHQDSDLAGKPDLLGKKNPNAPTEARLYALDVTFIDELPGRSMDPGNETLGFVVLDDPDLASVPVDVLAWPGATDSTDRVLVLFDDLDGTGRVVAYDIDVAASPPQLQSLFDAASDTPPSPAVVFELEVGAAPRQFVQMPRDQASDPRVVLVSHAGSSTVAQLTVDGDAVTLDEVAGVGPTSRIVPVDAETALALRADVPAAVVLEAVGGRFARSSRELSSPYTPGGAGSPLTEPGRLDLPQVAITGAIGFPVGFPGIEDATEIGIVMLALVDGTAVFLRGDDQQLVINEPSEVTTVRGAFEGDPTYIRECGPGFPWCVDPENPPPTCVGLVRTARADDVTYRAGVRGALVSTDRWFFLSALDGADVALEVHLDLAGAHAVKLQDRVEIQAGQGCPRFESVSGAATATLSAAWQVSGVVHAIDGGRFEVAVDEVTEKAVADAQGNITSVPVPVADIRDLELSACEGVARLQILSGEDEVVLAELDGSEVVEVHARVPVMAGIGDSKVARIDVRPDGEPAPLAFTLVAPGGFDSSVGKKNNRSCVRDGDCGPGRRCVETPQKSDETCPSRCSDCEGVGCSDGEAFYLSSGVELRVAGAEVARLDLGLASLRDELNTNETVNAVPQQTVWLPVWNQWVTSFPGSRTLVRLEYGSEAVRVGVTR